MRGQPNQQLTFPIVFDCIVLLLSIAVPMRAGVAVVGGGGGGGYHLEFLGRGSGGGTGNGVTGKGRGRARQGPGSDTTNHTVTKPRKTVETRQIRTKSGLSTLNVGGCHVGTPWSPLLEGVYDLQGLLGLPRFQGLLAALTVPPEGACRAHAGRGYPIGASRC